MEQMNEALLAAVHGLLVLRVSRQQADGSTSRGQRHVMERSWQATPTQPFSAMRHVDTLQACLLQHLLHLSRCQGG